MEIINFILTIIYTYFIGYCITNSILSFFKTKIDLFSFFGLCGIIGFGASAIELFIFSLLKIPWNQNLIVIPWLLIIVYLFIKKQYKFKINRIKIVDLLALFFFLFIAIILIGWTLTNPIWAWDGWAIWNFKAHVFYFRGFIPLDFLKSSGANFDHPEYPLLLPLSQTWIYLFLAKIQTGFSQIIYVVYYFSMMLISFSFFKKITKNYMLPLVLTILLALTPNMIAQSQVNYADILVGISFLLGLIYLIKWVKFKLKIDLYFMSILLGLGAFTKQEGGLIYILFILFILLDILFGNRKKLSSNIKTVVFPISLGVIPWMIWVIYCKIHGLDTSILTSNINLHFLSTNTDRFHVIFSAIYHQITDNFSSAGFIWPLFAFVAILALYFRLETKRYYFLILVTVFCYIMIYYITPSELFKWYLAASLDRLMLQITPAAIFISSYTLLMLWNSKNKSR